MISLNHSVVPQVLNNHLSVQSAASYSGYCMQYLRRLLRSGKLASTKIGQIWLIEKDFLDTYIQNAEKTEDKRFGPK